MTQRPETLSFQAEVQELLGLMIHSLYKHEEIFLRELISNASDALDKLRFESLTKPELRDDSAPLGIRLEVDAKKRTLAVLDNGVGMNRAELVENLGTIARSGTRQFLERARAASKDGAPDLIGQFGVGFYSSFIVADQVTVETRRAGETQGWRWRSDGAGSYTVEEIERDAHGTRVTLHLRAKEKGEDAQDFLSEWTIRDVVKRYSDFVAYPIEMEVEHVESDPADPKTKPRTVKRVETLNSMTPLWSRSKDEIERAEYDEFYKHLAHDWNAPLEVIHFRAEGATEYTALMYIPAERPLGFFEDAKSKSRLRLYVRRVLIMNEAPDLLPSWMRFVTGLVDSPDLPLNVSREVLQASPAVRQINKRLTKRVLETLAHMLAEDRDKYRRFWDAFGALMKEGLYLGEDEDQRISKISLFETTHVPDAAGEGAAAPTTLGEYVARAQSGQKAIYYLTGADRKALEASPHLEALKRRGFEVLLLTDPVDEWLLERFKEYDKLPLVPIDRGDLDLFTEAEKEARESLDRENRDLLASLEEHLKEDVKTVRFSTRLTDSPAVLVNEVGSLSPNMERMLRAAHHHAPRTKRILELNPDHGLIKRLMDLHAKSPRGDEFREFTELLFGQALLAEGSPLPDAAGFARLLGKLMVTAST